MSEHRPFPPSPRRLALARRAGTHGASPLVTQAIAWIAMLVVAVGLGRAIAARLGEMIARACRGEGDASELPSQLLELALPLLAAAAIAAFITHVAQTRALWLPRRRLDRAPRMPRDREMRSLAFAAILGAATLAWLWLAAPALVFADARLLASFAAAIATTLVALAAIDAIVRRHRLARGLAMTHTERREDDRQSGADPRWRQLRAKLGAPDEVARASLVILGDDIAVAIAWDPQREPIPRRTAAGERARATQIVALGRRYALPIHRDPVLAARLATQLGPVPEAYWPRLAEIVAATRRS